MKRKARPIGRYVELLDRAEKMISHLYANGPCHWYNDDLERDIANLLESIAKAKKEFE